MTIVRKTSSIQSSPDQDVDASANVATVELFVTEVVNRGNRKVLNDLVHGDYRYHGPDGATLGGPDAAWRILGALREAFSDLNAEIVSETTEGDLVVVTLAMTGTHDGDFMGIPATGARIELPMAVVSRLKERRIIEEWEYYDSTTLISQITSSHLRSRNTLVLGGSGKTGRRVVERLTTAGLRVRSASRSSGTRFDWEDDSTWAPALVGVDAVYITYYPDLAFPGASDTVGRFADLAVASGVRRLVLLSGRGEEGARQTEERVRNSGADWTLVRCAFFNQNFSEISGDAIRAGELSMPAGDRSEPFLDAEDIADVVVAALTDDRHIGQLYELTGPRLMSLREVAEELSAAIGRDVIYNPVTVGHYADELASYGLPAEDAGAFAGLIAEVLDGRNAHLSDGVQQALGRLPRDFADWARDAAASGAWGLGGGTHDLD